MIILLVGGILSMAFWLWYTDRYEGVDLTPPQGFEGFRKTSYYALDPDSIIYSLDQNGDTLFSAEDTPPENPIFQQPFSWSQADFLKIGYALHRFVWNQSLEDWKYYSMYFITACHDHPDGFALGEFVYFKQISDKPWLKEYEVRGMQIAPQYGNVGAGGSEYYPGPLFESWKWIDLDRVAITAEEAMYISEQNGGQAVRVSSQNECHIHVKLSGYSGWQVFIVDDETGSILFYLKIDPYTGKLK
jgi:hypothetical protein